jgi:uncharacterized protein (TIGR03435 family)
MKFTAFVLAAATLAAAGVSAQSPSPAFEVASIKRNASGSLNANAARVAGDRYRAENVSLISLLRVAYAVQEFQIAGHPDWANVDRFDIDAKMDAGANARDWPLMLQRLLADRFKLAVHRESREGPIYMLVVGSNGPRLTAADPSKRLNPGGDFSASPTQIIGTGVSMAEFAMRLSRSIGVAVVDRTGLDGAFDLKLTWPPDDRFVGRGASASPTIFTAIQEQLGLRLQPGRGPVEMLVVDRAEKPVPD